VLALPQTFMNRSGDAVAPLRRELGLAPDRLLVVVDDLSLPLGALRLRPKGSAGGHNGLRSIDDALAATHETADEETADRAAFADYPRLRVGIGNSFAPGFQAEFVLSRFEPEERAAADAAFARAAEAVRTVVDGGVAAAMTTVNRRS
jgi:PTH1 family peptidyl-tRNA hydrolase